MLTFYKQVAASFAALVLLSAIVILAGLQLSTFQAELLPNTRSDIAWQPHIAPQVPDQGTATTIVDDGGPALRWQYTLDKDNPFPYAAYILDFSFDERAHIDLSAYEYISFRALAFEPSASRSRYFRSWLLVMTRW